MVQRISRQRGPSSSDNKENEVHLLAKVDDDNDDVEYVSDSETDHDVELDSSIISKTKLVKQLNGLSPDSNTHVRNYLKYSNRFNHLFTNSQWDSLSILNFDDVVENSEDDDYDQLGKAKSPSSAVPVDVVSSRPRSAPRERDEQPRPEQNDDSNNLQIYLDSRNYEPVTSRRRTSLRKRNFASTHPYLTDQIHYLGLSNLNYINELYDSEQNLENIVKLLNYNYMKLKKKYPYDDKYKSKNFYTILGKQSQLARNLEQQEKDKESASKNTKESEDTGNGPYSSQVINNSDEEDDDAYNEPDFDEDEEDEFLNFGRRHHHSHHINNSIIMEEDDEDDQEQEHKQHQQESDTDEESQENGLIQVGGRLIKEKNILRGVLPESAKRLEMYKPMSRKKKNSYHRKRLMEYRKGLAVKKSSGKLHRDDNEFSGFLYDGPDESDSTEVYHDIDAFVDAAKSPTPEPSILDTLGILSDSSSSSSSEVEYDESNRAHLRNTLKTDNNDADDNQLSDSGFDLFDFDSRAEDFETSLDQQFMDSNEDDGYGSVVETDYINPMFTTASEFSGSKRKPTKKRKTGVFTATKLRTTLSPSVVTNTSSKSSSKPKSGSYSSRGGSSKTHNRKQRFLSDTTFRKLPTRRIASSANSAINRSSTITTKSKKKQKSKTKKANSHTLDLLLLGSRNNKDVLNDYLFSRDPVQSTLVFEAESDRKFIKHHNQHVNPSAPRSVYASTAILRNGVLFPNDYILAEIDMYKLKSLGEGKSYVLMKDSVNVSLLGERYVFTLVNSDEESMNSMEKLLSHMLKLARNLGTANDTIIQELYGCIKGVLTWWIIFQSSPSEKIWKVVANILNVLSQTKDPASLKYSKFLYPYFILIYYQFSIITNLNSSRIISPPQNNNDLMDYCIRYWNLFFHHFEPEQFNNLLLHGSAHPSKEFESFHVMYLLLNMQGKFWYSINKCLETTLITEIDISILLECVYALICSDPNKACNWTPFYILYGNIAKEEESNIHNRFLDLVYILSQRYNWPIQEKMILLLYSTITSRRFANFGDEWAVPELLGRIRTRSDIPIDSFFERFMLFLYSYVSALPDGSNTKRLVTKLFTSSYYIYADNKEHFVMFVNRMNFTLLLAQLSEVDLKNQIFDLVSRITDSKDYGILKLSVKSLKLYIEIIMIKSRLNLPIESISALILAVSKSFFTQSGALKLWTSLMKIFEMLTTSTRPIKYSVQFLEVYSNLGEGIPDRFLFDINPLLLSTLGRLAKESRKEIRSKKLDHILKAIIDINNRRLNIQMNRIPLPTISEESKVERSVEICFKIWTTSSYLMVDSNWTMMALQIFPYLGNHHSREKFALYFYSEVLKFTNLKACKENIIVSILSSLASFSTSRYIPRVIDQLISENNEIFAFPKSLVPDGFNSFHIQNHRAVVISTIFSNISKSQKLADVNKKLFVVEFLKTMSNEFNNYFTSKWYRELCVQSVKSIQKYCSHIDGIKDTMALLASKLGISQSELDRFNWQSKPIKQQLTTLNSDLLHAIHFNQNYNDLLMKYTTGEGVGLIYHLVSIYTKSILLRQHEKWKIIHILLSFFYIQIRQCKFEISVFYKKFLKSIAETPKLSNHDLVAASDKAYRLKAMISIAKILLYSFTLFDGYKDIDFISEVSNTFVSCLELSHQSFTWYSLEYPYSPYKLLDILPPGRDITTQAIVYSESELAQLETELNRLVDLLSGKVSPPPQTSQPTILDFDFQF